MNERVQQRGTSLAQGTGQLEVTVNCNWEVMLYTQDTDASAFKI